MEIAEKFVARARNLATDGYIVYDIQDEDGRTDLPRPFPFRRTLDPSSYGGCLARASGKQAIIYKCAVGDKREDFERWVDKTTKTHGHAAVNVVGGATSSKENGGVDVPAASKILRDQGVAIGGICIAERHLTRLEAGKAGEHLNMQRKVDMGFQWFISQAIYDAAATVKLLQDYGRLCRARGVTPKKVVLTFAPCGRAKTMTFIKWLGVCVPEVTEKAILEADSPVATSVELLCGLLRTILTDAAGCGVPLGISVESVSIFKEEIDAAETLFRKTQQLLLDAQGTPWCVRWFHTGYNQLPLENGAAAPPDTVSVKGQPLRVVDISSEGAVKPLAGLQALRLAAAALAAFVVGRASARTA